MKVEFMCDVLQGKCKPQNNHLWLYRFLTTDRYLCMRRNQSLYTVVSVHWIYYTLLPFVVRYSGLSLGP
jgi:hypothetical protein